MAAVEVVEETQEAEAVKKTPNEILHPVNQGYKIK